MIRIVLLLFCFWTTLTSNAQPSTLYSKAFGENENAAIIFIHGGPSGNATLFEGTTAAKLAAKGYYVIVYDRRGEGRSVDTTATFTYQEASKDLEEIYRTYSLKKANLIAHSFGGLIATLFTEQNPNKVNSLILAGALVSQQETYSHILKSVARVYKDKKDTLMLSEISRIQKLSTKGAEYRKECFDLASQNNYFKMPYPSKEANFLWDDYKRSELYKTNIRNTQAPLLFYKNETKTNIDTKPILNKIKSNDVQLFAIYGQQDAIFSSKQLNDIKKIVGKENFKIIDNCSHYLFVDQQDMFLETVLNWIK